MFRPHPEAEREEKVSELAKNSRPAEVKRFSLRVRFDYKGLPRPSRFFFGGKGSKEVAEETRRQQAAMWRNVPIQGVRVEDANFFDLYSVYDEPEGEMVFYAPMELLVTVGSLGDFARFICRDEFRCLEILEPDQVTLDSRELERIFYKFSEEVLPRLRKPQV